MSLDELQPLCPPSPQEESPTRTQLNPQSLQESFQLGSLKSLCQKQLDRNSVEDAIPGQEELSIREEMAQHKALLQDFLSTVLEREVSQMRLQFERIEKDLQLNIQQVVHVEIQRECLPYMSEIYFLKQELTKLSVAQSRKDHGHLDIEAVCLQRSYEQMLLQMRRQELKIHRLEEDVNSLAGTRSIPVQFLTTRNLRVPTTPPNPCQTCSQEQTSAPSPLVEPHDVPENGELHGTFPRCSAIKPEEDFLFVLDEQNFTDHYARRASSSCEPDLGLQLTLVHGASTDV